MKKIFILLIIGLMFAGITPVTVAATCNVNNDGSIALNGCYLGVYPGCGSEDISCETI